MAVPGLGAPGSECRVDASRTAQYSERLGGIGDRSRARAPVVAFGGGSESVSGAAPSMSGSG